MSLAFVFPGQGAQTMYLLETQARVNLAAALARAPQRVLLVDLDSQGNATMGSGVDKREVEASTCDVLLGEVDAKAAVVTTPEGFDLLPGNIDLTAAEIQLMDVDGREQRLKSALQPIRDDYDFIIVDCPPALSLLTLNALTAADSVLVPMQCEYYALEGLSALMETIEALRARYREHQLAKHDEMIKLYPGMVETVRASAEKLGYSHRDIISGAGHDACWINRVAPTVMIMCPCVDGLSHNEAEKISPEWAAAGTDVLLHAVLEVAGVV